MLCSGVVGYQYVGGPWCLQPTWTPCSSQSDTLHCPSLTARWPWIGLLLEPSSYQQGLLTPPSSFYLQWHSQYTISLLHSLTFKPVPYWQGLQSSPAFQYLQQLDGYTNPLPSYPSISIIPTSYWLPDCPFPSILTARPWHPLVLQAYTYALSLSAIHFTLKMEAARSSEMLVFYCSITWHYNPEDDLNLHCHENLESYT